MSLYGELPLTGELAIRVLRLLPADQADEPIICSLEAHSFETQYMPPYEALSYCWGSEKTKHEISCNCEKKGVTENLWHALVSLRRPDTERVLWIDAICINQADDAERTAQVKLMRRIYSSCSMVIVWLGQDPYTEGLNHVFELANSSDLHLRLDRLRPRIFSGPLASMKFNITPILTSLRDRGPDQNAELATELSPLPPLPQATIDGYDATTRNPYWTRVWIVQELVLAPEISLICGPLSTTWTRFTDAISVIAQGINDRRDISKEAPMDASFDTFLRLRLSRHSHISKGQMSVFNELVKLLKAHRFSNCTDKRDKIYGLLGLANSSLDITPDYKIPLAECYKRAAYSIICGTGNLDILESLIRPSCITQGIRQLPSWTPDWSCGISDVPPDEARMILFNTIQDFAALFDQFAKKKVYPQFCASGTSTERIYPSLDSDGQTLLLQGYVIGKLSFTGRKLASMTEFSVGDRAADISLLGNVMLAIRLVTEMGKLSAIIRVWEKQAKRNLYIQRAPNESLEDALLATMTGVLYQTGQGRDELANIRSRKKAFVKPYRLISIMENLGMNCIFPKVFGFILGFHIFFASGFNGESLSSSVGFILSLAVQGCMDHKLAITQEGHLVLGAHNIRKGDRVVILKGGRTPFIARRKGQRWQLLGHCYAHNVMFGERWDEAQCVNMRIC